MAGTVGISTKRITIWRWCRWAMFRSGAAGRSIRAVRRRPNRDLCRAPISTTIRRRPWPASRTPTRWRAGFSTSTPPWTSTTCRRNLVARWRQRPGRPTRPGSTVSGRRKWSATTICRWNLAGRLRKQVHFSWLLLTTSNSQCWTQRGSLLKNSSYTLQNVRKIPPILGKFQAKKIPKKFQNLRKIPVRKISVCS